MRLSARVDYALRAVVELAATEGERLVTAERLARNQGIPGKFLENIMVQLRRGGIVNAQRGAEGGYFLARPAKDINLAEIIRVIDGPLAHVRGHRPELLGYQGSAKALQQVWIALRCVERQILEQVTVADVATNRLPESIQAYVSDPQAWK
ncbi:MAG: Rrf2 family transcriptional regulator [Longispora sp.]|nr:Rrf2 family transcriptional regulator [Longispora sp. (in: high G+C Gram-positive bacteria)]